MKIFIDANILFSAAKEHSKMWQFFQLLCREYSCVTSSYALEEARRDVILKFKQNIDTFENNIKKCEIIQYTPQFFNPDIKIKDQPIILAAILCKATHLLTGDERDFGRFFGKVVQGVKIVSPKLLAEEINNK